MYGSKRSSRPGQWDGRRRSSRCDEAMLPRLWPQQLAASGDRAADHGGRHLSCLLLRLRRFVPGGSGLSLRNTLAHLFRDDQPDADPRPMAKRRSALRPNCGDPVACEAARQSVPPVKERDPPGSSLVQLGQPITEVELALLHQKTRPPKAAQRWTTASAAALFLVLCLLAVLVVLYVVRFQRSLAQSLPRILGVCAGPGHPHPGVLLQCRSLARCPHPTDRDRPGPDHRL